MITYEYGVKSWLSPRNAVTGVGVTVPCTVTWTAAIFMKPPVSQHAAVTVQTSNTRLTCALPTARVTEKATPWEDRAYRVAGTSCRGDRWQNKISFCQSKQASSCLGQTLKHSAEVKRICRSANKLNSNAKVTCILVTYLEYLLSRQKQASLLLFAIISAAWWLLVTTDWFLWQTFFIHFQKWHFCS